MKQLFMKAIGIVVAASVLTSCATVFGGARTEYQKTKPKAGEPKRELRVGALVADMLFGLVPVVVDFSTGAIYKPAPTKK